MVTVVFPNRHLAFIESSFPRSQIGDYLKKQTFRLASYLTDPICKAHELFRRIYVVDVLNPTAFKVSNLVRKFFISLGIVVNLSLAIGSTVPGICLRGVASCLEKEPFIYYRGKLPDEQLQESFSLLSWNICCVAGGYSISDGGVMPWSFRIDKIVETITQQNADFISLYEVFDTASGFYLYEKLREKYAYFYFNIGPRAIGTSSGIFIASKIKITDPEFTPFPKHMLVGRTKNSEKGVFSFTIQTSKENVKIYATHLQHSEEPQYPTDEEVWARSKEMKLIMDKIDQEVGSIILIGDLNLDNEEYAQSAWASSFQEVSFAENGARTWGGDKFCAEMIGKRISGPLNLDYTLATKQSALKIKTSLIATHYDAKKCTREALSDHRGLVSLVVFDKGLKV